MYGWKRNYMGYEGYKFSYNYCADYGRNNGYGESKYYEKRIVRHQSYNKLKLPLCSWSF